MSRGLLVSLISLVVGYGLIEARSYIIGPSLILESPQENASLPQGACTVRGRALRLDTLTLNGAPLLRDTGGAFSTTLTLPPGASFITLTGSDRFGRKVSLTRSVFVPNP